MNFYRCKGCAQRFLGTSSTGSGRCPTCGGRLFRVWMPDVPRAESGSYDESGHTYASMEDFVQADPRRLLSPEVDFGLSWRESESEPTHRAAWIEETGELYLVQTGAPSAGGGHVEVLAATDRPGVEEALADWSAQCRRAGSLGWIRRRTSRLPQFPTRSSGRSARSSGIRRMGAVVLGAAALAFAGCGDDGLSQSRASGPGPAPSHHADARSPT